MLEFPIPCRILPFGFGREAEFLYDLTLGELEALHVGDGAPSAVGLRLLPSDSHDRVVIIPRMVEVLGGVNGIS